MSINLLDDVAPASDLGALMQIGIAMQELEKAIASTEESLKMQKQELQQLSENILPDMMQELKVKNFTLEDGSKVEVHDILSASVPSQTAIDRCKTEEDKMAMIARQQDCLNWLRDNNLGSVIKSNVEVRFGKDDDEQCNKFIESLVDQGMFFKRSIGVHPQTLTKVISEKKSSGVNVPDEIFRVYTGRKATIKRGK